MKQAITLKGAPDTIKSLLETEILTKTVISISKTFELNTYSCIVDDSATIGQEVTLVSSDSNGLKIACDDILATKEIDCIIATDSRPTYLIVSH